MDEKIEKPYNEFSRYEDKYICDMEDFDQIKSTIEEHMKPSYLEGDTKSCLVKSTYLDSDNLFFLRQHLNRDPDRHKIRIRQYAPDGVWSDERYIELKSKDDSESKKVRFLLDTANYQKVMHGLPMVINDALAANNPKATPEFVKQWIEAMNGLIRTFDLHPVLETSYLRYAYADGVDRATIDKDVKWKNLDPAHVYRDEDLADMLESECVDKFDPKENIIVESKNDGSVPDWFEEMMDDLDQDEVSFSKYCWAMSQMLETQYK